jgi:iron complex outermembrane receptor protein
VQTYAPETITDYEIGLKTDFKTEAVKGRFDISAFTSEYKNAIQFFNFANLIPVGVVVPDAPNNGSIGVNVANETIQGIEVSATAIPSAIKGLTLSFNGAYTDSKVDSLAPVPIPGISFTKSNITLPSPRMSGAATLRYVLPVTPLDGLLVFAADYYRSGKFGAQFGVDLPGYGVANARLDWIDIASTGLDLGFAVTNFTDERYFTGPSVLLPNFAISSVATGAPRMWVMDIKYSF